MFLKKAEGCYFRNYDKFSIEFNSLVNIFTGDNGQGKSSLLEALYCGLRGKSFHSFIHSQFIQNHQIQAKICLSLEEENGLSKLESSFMLSGNSLKKEIFYCGRKVGPLFLSKKIPCFVFTEASVKCIRQGAGERRAFIDEMLSGRQKQEKSLFQQVLQQKQTLLKDFKKGRVSLNELERTLSALNPQFLKQSFILVQARLKRLIQLFSSAQKLRQEFFKGPQPQLSFSYLLNENQELNEDLEIFKLLEEDLNKKKAQEIQAGFPLSGPQKHEIFFLFNGEDSRIFCSKGEQRAYMLVLLLSHIQEFPKAFLFLDDVLLELDEETQRNFLYFLEKNHCQSFLTNCKVTSFKTKNMSSFSIKEGVITKHG